MELYKVLLIDNYSRDTSVDIILATDVTEDVANSLTRELIKESKDDSKHYRKIHINRKAYNGLIETYGDSEEYGFMTCEEVFEECNETVLHNNTKIRINSKQPYNNQIKKILKTLNK